MLMVRYYRDYTVVTYDICVMASVGRNSSRAVAATWLYTLCDRYSITSILPVLGYLRDTSMLV